MTKTPAAAVRRLMDLYRIANTTTQSADWNVFYTAADMLALTREGLGTGTTLAGVLEYTTSKGYTLEETTKLINSMP